jgi:hypothetical protein
MCGDIMKLEGSWDPATSSFRTRESVLQQRTHLVGHMHRTLRVNPNLQYALQSGDQSFTYPQCPAVLLKTTKTKPADLGIADPKSENIERCMTAAMERRRQPMRLPQSRVGTDDAIEQLEQTLLAEAFASVSRFSDDDGRSSVDAAHSLYGGGLGGTRHGGGNVSAMSADHLHSAYGESRWSMGHQFGRNATPAVGGSPSSRSRGAHATSMASPTAAGASPATGHEAGEDDEGYLPDIGAGGQHQYSSMLVELRMTRRDAQKRAKKHSALQAILNMDGSADLKRTITRMFADPKNADAISAEEAERREQRYQDDKQTQIRQQTRLLAEERSLMDKELAMFK